MFVVPITGRVSWRNPPLLTIGLVLLNFLVFFWFQSGDRQRLVEAEKYYFDSGLARLEVPKYLEYRHRLDRNHRPADPDDLNRQALEQYHRKIEQDYHFLEKLRQGAVITPRDAQYDQWTRLRRIYQARLDQVLSVQYGFRPAYPKPSRMITYMFLHGGLLHLLGNMLFLWLIGCALEMGSGRSFYFATYIVGGLAAVSAYWLTHLYTTAPLIGASGAVAALMGAYTVVFGKQRVNIFFSLGFYFNYIRIPAIVLLPVWIGEEIFQLFFSGIGHVAYAAHIGGLLCGAALGLLGRKYAKALIAGAPAQRPEVEIASLLQAAVERITEIDFQEGRRMLRRVVARDPGNVSALTHLFNLEKNMPQSESVHATAAKLLELLSRHRENWSRAHQVYAEYAAAVGTPRFSAQLFLKLVNMFAALGRTEQAGSIMTALAAKRADLPGLPAALLSLARAFRQNGRTDKATDFLEHVVATYPDTSAAQTAREELRHMGH